jgi:hypothetical protein
VVKHVNSYLPPVIKGMNEVTMKNKEDFIKAYHDFKESVDFKRSGILPDFENLVWYLLMGVPSVPADEETSADAPMVAVEQRVYILKAVFVEVDKDQSDDFLDRGLLIYDQAAKKAKILLKEENLAQTAE